MADEPQAAVSTTSPLSSPAPSPSPTAAPTAPAAASTSTPAPVTTAPTSAPTATTPPSTPVARPEGIPDERWDSTANALKLTAEEYAAEQKERNELKAFQAAETARKNLLPSTPEAYKVELPTDFKPPPGVEFKLDAADPAFGQVKSWAHKWGIPQEAVNEVVGVWAGREVGTDASIKDAAAKQVAILGATGPARVDNSTKYLDAVGLPSWKQMMVTAQQVIELENFMTRQTTQGGAQFSQAHRAAPDTNKIPNYEGMTFAQRRQAQDALAARRKA